MACSAFIFGGGGNYVRQRRKGNQRRLREREQDLTEQKDQIKQLQEEDKHFQTIVIVSKAIKENPTDLELLHLRGISKKVLGDYHGAEVDLEHSRQIARDKNNEVRIDIEDVNPLDPEVIEKSERAWLDLGFAFKRAIEENDFRGLEKIAELVNIESLIVGRSPIICDSEGNTPLHLAAYSESVRIIEYLSSFPFDFNIENRAGESPFSILFNSFQNAIRDDNIRKLKQVSQCIGSESLMERNSITCREDTPLHLAAYSFTESPSRSLEIMDYLVSVLRFPIDTPKNSIGDTPFSILLNAFKISIRERDISRLKEINRFLHLEKKLKKGEILSYEHNDWPLHLAVQMGYIEIVAYLIESLGFDLNAMDAKNETPLSVAINNRDDKMINYLREELGAKMTEQIELYETLIRESPEKAVQLYYWRGEDYLFLGDQADRRGDKILFYQKALEDMSGVLSKVAGYPKATVYKDDIEFRLKELHEDSVEEVETDEELLRELEEIERRQQQAILPESSSSEGDRIEESSSDGYEEILQRSTEIPSDFIVSHELIEKTGEELGSGGFGVVYKGVDKRSGMVVAIKELLKEMTSEEIESFKREAEIMSRLRHPNVVLFTGICLDPGHYYIIMEFAEYGSLYDILRSERKLTWHERLKVAEDTGMAIAHLHNWKPQIIHRDLKSLNVLVMGDLTAKVSDFGLSEMRETDPVPSKWEGNPIGTYTWMAPELHNEPRKYNEKTDVYSYGVILFELLTRQVPYEGTRKSAEFVHKMWIVNGKRDSIPEACPPSYASLIKRCWAQRAEDRPAMVDVVDDIRRARPEIVKTMDKDEGMSKEVFKSGPRYASKSR